MTRKNLDQFFKKFNITPKNRELFEMAFTHSSFNSDAKTTHHDYERLEFIGDSVLGFVVASLIYKYHPEMKEVRLRAYGQENYAEHEFVNGSFEENDAAILQERLLEFALECKRWFDLVRFDKAFDLVPSLAGRDNPELLYFPIPNSVLSLEPLVEPNSGWPV